MFLSNFSIKQAGDHGGHHHHPHVPGPDRAQAPARQPDPGRAGTGDGGELPVPGRIAGDRGARNHQSRREVAAEHSAGLRDCAPPLRRATAASSSSSTSRRTCPSRATRCATRLPAVRYKLPIEMREPVLWRFDPSAEPIMNLALSSTTQSHTEISRLAEDMLADRLRGIDGVAQVNVDGSLQARALGAAARAEAARVQRLGRATWSTRCDRRTPPRRSAASRARSTSRASAWSDASSRRRNSTTSWSSARATKWCAWARSPPSRTASPSRRAISLRNGAPQRRPVRHPLARVEHGLGGQASARGSRRDQQDAARRHQARGHARRWRGRPAAVSTT